MILEIADIRIAPGQNAAFDEAIARGVATVASRAKGFRGYQVHKGIAVKALADPGTGCKM